MILYPRLNYSLSADSWLTLLNPFSPLKQTEPDMEPFFSGRKIFYYNHARSGLTQILKQSFKGCVVGVQPFTCPTVLDAIREAGCETYFIDINTSLIIDEEILKLHLEKIDVLILTHTFGFMADVPKIRELIHRKPLIEDCAHAFLSHNGNIAAGMTGDFAIFSFGFAKFPSAVSGGFVIVNNTDYLNNFENNYRLLPGLGCLDGFRQRIMAIFQLILYSMPLYGLFTVKQKAKRNIAAYRKSPCTPTTYPYPFCQEIFRRELQNIDRYLNTQKQNAQRIIESIQNNKAISLLQQSDEMNCFQLAVHVENPDKLISYAGVHGIEFGRQFYKSKYIVPHFGYKQGCCPNYEMLIEKIVTIPCHYHYSQRKIQQICELIKTYNNE